MPGCILAEVLTGFPLFPGDTDIDQIYRITRHLGPFTLHHYEIFSSNPLYIGIVMPEVYRVYPLSSRFPRLGYLAINWLEQTLVYDSESRASTHTLMMHPFFTADGFPEIFELQLIRLMAAEREKELAERTRRKRGNNVSF
jgi:cyclin-dependent kinase-like